MRLDNLNWTELEASLSSRGYAATPRPVLDADECEELIALYDDDSRFRSRIDMARYRFGEGEYKYFANPLPALVRTLREGLYPPLALVANRWMEQLEQKERYPERLQTFLERRERPDQANAAAVTVRGGRLQLPAPGHLRRRRVSAASRCLSFEARCAP